MRARFTSCLHGAAALRGMNGGSMACARDRSTEVDQEDVTRRTIYDSSAAVR